MRRLLNLVLLLMVACASPAEQAPAAEDAEAEPLQLAYQGLCDARALAEAGDVAGASDVFQDRSHAYLHELAASLFPDNQPAAARLLEAKQTLETHLSDPESANHATVVAALTTLQAALRVAAESVGFDRPACEG